MIQRSVYHADARKGRVTLDRTDRGLQVRQDAITPRIDVTHGLHLREHQRRPLVIRDHGADEWIAVQDAGSIFRVRDGRDLKRTQVTPDERLGHDRAHASDPLHTLCRLSHRPDLGQPVLAHDAGSAVHTDDHDLIVPEGA